MSAKRLLLGTVVLGVVMNLLDVLVHGFALASINPTIEGARMEDWMMPWFVVGDFISAFMLTWFYGIVRGSFSSGWKFGAWKRCAGAVQTVVNEALGAFLEENPQDGSAEPRRLDIHPSPRPGYPPNCGVHPGA